VAICRERGPSYHSGGAQCPLEQWSVQWVKLISIE
jgi:hypothetical protein